MSLLMAALKKAEETKRQATEQTTGTKPSTPPELTLTPMTEPAKLPENSANSPLPDLSMHFAAVDADLANVSTEAPSRQPPSPASLATDTERQEAAERSAVRNAFAVKQPTKAPLNLWLFIGIGVIAVLGVGGYFWWQLRTVSTSTLARPPQAPPPAQATAPVEAQPKWPASATENAKPMPEILPPAGPSALKAVPYPEPPPSEPVARAPKPPSSGSRALAADRPVQFNGKQPRSNLTLERAYDALQSGKLDESARAYEQILRSDAKNTDALLGLATIAARQGQTEKAQDYYLRALESDPNDATAQAGLINTRGQSDPGLAESRLKTSLAGQPDSTALLFALGNLYARQARWSEAQQAYFRAYSTEPDNADIIFNLAVSLDHLRQNKLAAQYYQRALSTADADASRSVNFDRNLVKRRILELQP